MENKPLKTLNEIKEMIEKYDELLDECNRIGELQGRSIQEQQIETQLRELTTEISNVVTAHISQFLADLAGAGVNLKNIDLLTLYREEPYHSLLVRIGKPKKQFMAGFPFTKHIRVEGYPYPPARED